MSQKNRISAKDTAVQSKRDLCRTANNWYGMKYRRLQFYSMFCERRNSMALGEMSEEEGVEWGSI
jgi:hypothetical protein